MQEITLSSVIDLVGIKKNYVIGDQIYPVLKGIDLAINSGDFLAIMGASGTGKSTLMNIIGLLDHPTSGQYFLNGKDITSLNDDNRSYIRNQTIGFVFQSFYLLPRLTALQNVMLPTLYHKTRMENPEERARDLLSKVEILPFANNKPNQMSGGQQQRVAIARALICNPTLILADEPTGMLDSKTTEEVMALFTELNEKEGTTIVVVTHSSEIGNRCKRMIVMKDGMIVES